MLRLGQRHHGLVKTNNNWVGGELLPKYYKTWALFFSKYISAYKQIGIDIWDSTVENEPLGNGGNWESMHYTPESMTQFVNEYLGPQLEADFNKNIIFWDTIKIDRNLRNGWMKCIKTS